MPTISGLRRRGYTADAIREFCDDIGVGKVKGMVALHKLEYHHSPASQQNGEARHGGDQSAKGRH